MHLIKHRNTQHPEQACAGSFGFFQDLVMKLCLPSPGAANLHIMSTRTKQLTLWPFSTAAVGAVHGCDGTLHGSATVTASLHMILSLF